MYSLYMDNFRGFQDTLIPMKDINFLVGENSTGKTSVMALINVLSSIGFWMSSMSLDTEEVKLGNFEDIVSAHAMNKKYFRVGMCLSDEREKSLDAFLITYKEREGMPTISRYTREVDKKLVDVKFGTERLRFTRKMRSATTDDGIETSREWFDTWRHRHDESRVYYTTIKSPMKFRLMRSLGALNSYLLSEEEVDKGRDRSISVRMSIPYPRTIWLAPIRTKPKRTYDEYSLEYSPEGEHTPYLIKKYFRKKEAKKRFLEFVRDFGINSGLFQTIEVKNFGRTLTAPFELDVSLNDTVLKILNVGYGVSQALPVIVELFEQKKDTCFFIQQPEVHLHPRGQAAMGELFFELSIKENKDFIVETHSDFIIDRFRLKLRDSKNKPESQVLYFTRDSKGNSVYPIEILDNGEFTDKQPPGYRDFFVREQMNILGL